MDQKDWAPHNNPQAWSDLSSELQKRQILLDSAEDKIRWRKNSAGLFNLKEAYRYIAKLDQLQLDSKWNSIWDRKQWPKISTFLWLVMHMKILTWDNLRRKGFISPARFHLCQQEEETPNHLLNECPYVSKFWDWILLVFNNSYRDPSSIQNTIANWRSSFSSHLLVNCAWNLIPGLVCWALWKERSARIFWGISTQEEIIISKIKREIREMVTSLPTQCSKAPPTNS